MYFGAERRGQGEVKGTGWRHWLDHVRYLSSVVGNLEFDHIIQDTLREQRSRV
jgi:hypothetical protein